MFISVDGGWSEWQWSPCSVTCDSPEGFTQGTRHCNNPQPSHGGQQCSGLSETKMICSNMPPCPLGTNNHLLYIKLNY